MFVLFSFFLCYWRTFNTCIIRRLTLLCIFLFIVCFQLQIIWFFKLYLGFFFEFGFFFNFFFVKIIKIIFSSLRISSFFNIGHFFPFVWYYLHYVIEFNIWICFFHLRELIFSKQSILTQRLKLWFIFGNCFLLYFLFYILFIISFLIIISFVYIFIPLFRTHCPPF